jgi:hypothetical protein
MEGGHDGKQSSLVFEGPMEADQMAWGRSQGSEVGPLRMLLVWVGGLRFDLHARFEGSILAPCTG